MKRKIKTIRKGLRMTLGKFRRRRLHHLNSVTIMICFFVLNFILYLVVSNYVSKKTKG